jgi:hypothetical protein
MLRKGGLTFNQYLTTVVLVIVGAIFLAFIKAESAFNAENLESFSQFQINRAFSEKIATTNCLLATNSLNQTRWYVLNMSKLKETKDYERLPCIEFDDVVYAVRVEVYDKPGRASVDVLYEGMPFLFRIFNNTEIRSEYFSGNPQVYYMVTDDGYPAKFEIYYINYTGGA